MDTKIAGIIKAGIVQDGAETIDHGLLLIGDYAGKAAAADCGILCFPEAFLTGYSTNTPVSLKRDDHVITQVSGIAIKTGVDLIVGFIESDEYLYITQGIFFADGRIEFYRKTHLGENESKIFKQGNELPVFERLFRPFG